LGDGDGYPARPAGDVDDRWTLRAADRALLGNKSGATRLGFAVLLKLFQAEGRFPRRAEDVPVAAVEAVAGQVGVAATAWHAYDWRGRTIEYHRAQIRTALGFREATLDDAEALGRWLDSQVLALERRPDRLLAAARERCRDRSVEPPSPERLERLVRSVLHRHEDAFCAALLARLPPEAMAGLETLLHPPSSGEAAGSEPRPAPPLVALRAGTGQASLQSVGEEAAKLACIRAVALPAGLFDGVPSRVLLAYRRRVGAEELHELRRHPDPIQLTLLAAFCHVRGREIADTLTDLLITTVHRIGAKAEKRVEGELMTDLKRVTGKSALLFKLAAASLSGMTTKTDTASEFRVSHLFTPPGILASWQPRSAVIAGGPLQLLNGRCGAPGGSASSIKTGQEPVLRRDPGMFNWSLSLLARPVHRFVE